jgi:hypothetical protein
MEGTTMICEEGHEYNGDVFKNCPTCLSGWLDMPDKERTILDLVHDLSGYYVRDLDQSRCSVCLRRLTCQLISQARRAKHGQLIAGLVIEQRRLRCRQYKYAGERTRAAVENTDRAAKEAVARAERERQAKESADRAVRDRLAANEANQKAKEAEIIQALFPLIGNLTAVVIVAIKTGKIPHVKIEYAAVG